MLQRARDVVYAMTFLQFVLVAIGAMLVVVIPLGTAAGALGSGADVDIRGLDSPMYFLLLVIIIAPLVETAVAQLVPFKVLRRLGVRGGIAFWVVSTAAFAILHLYNGIPQALSAGLGGGAILAFTFWRWSQVSIAKAFAATACCHAGYNLVLGGSILALSRLT